MKRNFEKWFTELLDCITGYKFFVDFSKTQSKVQELEKKLKILDTLIGSDNIEQEFEDLITQYPEILSCIPVLLAARNNELLVKEEGQTISFSFDIANHPIEKYKEFMKETGLFDLLRKRQIKSLSDYVFGIEVGLDSHSRKNRIGTEMEKLVCYHIQNAGYEPGKNFLTQTSLQKALEKWNLNSIDFSLGRKRFDFLLFNSPTKIFVVEVNFYGGRGGSKINAITRSYKSLYSEISKYSNLKFIWITDGLAWRNHKKILGQAFESMPNTIFNLRELEEGKVLSKTC